MLGGVDMTALWTDYELIPERPGLKVRNSKKLSSLFWKNRGRYLYSFKDARNIWYEAWGIGALQYVTPLKNRGKFFFYHRNPHHFKYFAPRHIAKE